MATYVITLKIRATGPRAEAMLKALEGTRYQPREPRWEDVYLVLVYSCEAATHHEATVRAVQVAHDVAGLIGLPAADVLYYVNEIDLDPPIEDSGVEIPL